MNRAQRNFRSQMAQIKKEERKKRKEQVFSYIEDKHISSYYEEEAAKPKLDLGFRIVRFFLFLIFLAEVWFTALSVLIVDDIKLQIGVMYSTFIALTLFIYGQISPRLIFMRSRTAAAAIFGTATFVLFVFTLYLATIY